MVFYSLLFQGSAIKMIKRKNNHFKYTKKLRSGHKWNHVFFHATLYLIYVFITFWQYESSVIGRVWTKVGSSCTVITMLTTLYTRSFTIDTMNHLAKTSLILVLVFLSQIGKSYSVIIYRLFNVKLQIYIVVVSSEVR